MNATFPSLIESICTLSHEKKKQAFRANKTLTNMAAFLLPSKDYVYMIKGTVQMDSTFFHCFLSLYTYFVFSHFWFATPQLVLQADWQDVWHSPQPPLFALSHKLRVCNVLILFIAIVLLFFVCCALPQCIYLFVQIFCTYEGKIRSTTSKRIP